MATRSKRARPTPKSTVVFPVDPTTATPDQLQHLKCPITFEIMTDPVVAADGHTYQREAFNQWLANSRKSPKTGVELPHLGVVENWAIRAIIDQYYPGTLRKVPISMTYTLPIESRDVPKMHWNKQGTTLGVLGSRDFLCVDPTTGTEIDRFNMETTLELLDSHIPVYALDGDYVLWSSGATEAVFVRNVRTKKTEYKFGYPENVRRRVATITVVDGLEFVAVLHHDNVLKVWNVPQLTCLLQTNNVASFRAFVRNGQKRVVAVKSNRHPVSVVSWTL